MRDVAGDRARVVAVERDEEHATRVGREGDGGVALDAADDDADRLGHAGLLAREVAHLHDDLLQPQAAGHARRPEVAVVRDRHAADGDGGRGAEARRIAEVAAEDGQVGALVALAALDGAAGHVGEGDDGRSGVRGKRRERRREDERERAVRDGLGHARSP